MAGLPKVSPGRLFIVGSPRSGTTLLQCLLAAHSQIVSLPETWFFYDLVPKHNKLARALKIAAPPQRGSYRRLLALIEVPTGLRLPRKPIFIGQYSRAFVRILDAWAEQQGKRFWLEKTPDHIRCIDIIEKSVPQARFIHIVRNGPDAIASHYDVIKQYPEHYNPNWGIDYCVDHWLEAARLTLKHVHKSNHLIVGYRQVAEETHAVMQRICTFVGAPFEAAILQDYSKQADRVVTAEEKWKAGVSQAICNRDGTKFHNVFTEEERYYILRRVAEVDLTPLCLAMNGGERRVEIPLSCAGIRSESRHD